MYTAVTCKMSETPNDLGARVVSLPCLLPAKFSISASWFMRSRHCPLSVQGQVHVGAENIASVALYSESTLKASKIRVWYEN